MLIHSISVIFSFFLLPSRLFHQHTHAYVSASPVTKKNNSSTSQHSWGNISICWCGQSLFLLLLQRHKGVKVSTQAAAICCWSHQMFCWNVMEMTLVMNQVGEWVSLLFLFVWEHNNNKQSNILLIYCHNPTTVMRVAPFLFFLFRDGRGRESGISWSKWRWRPANPQSIDFKLSPDVTLVAILASGSGS